MVGRRSSGFLSFGAFRCWGFIYGKENYTPVSYIATKIWPFEDEKGELSSWPLLVFGGVILIKQGEYQDLQHFFLLWLLQKPRVNRQTKRDRRPQNYGSQIGSTWFSTTSSHLAIHLFGEVWHIPIYHMSNWGAYDIIVTWKRKNYDFFLQLCVFPPQLLLRGPGRTTLARVWVEVPWSSTHHARRVGAVLDRVF